MYRKFFQLPVSCGKAFFLEKQLVFSGSCHSYIQKRGAGHAKWQNIKSTKRAADANKASTFQKFSRQILLAAKEGGEDPAFNSKLKQVIEEAYKCNMPKATVQKVLLSAKNQSSQPYWVVFKGPRGVTLAFEVTFNKKNASFINTKLAPQTKKLNLKMEVHHQDLCSETGVIICKCPQGGSYDQALEAGINYGAEEVSEGDNNTFIFECLPNRLEGITSQLSKLGYEIESSSIELDFKELVHLTDEEKNDLETIIEKIQSQNEEVLRAIYNSTE